MVIVMGRLIFQGVNVVNNDSPKMRRLKSDYENIISEFSGNKYINVEPLEESPCRKYRVIYKFNSYSLKESSKSKIQVELKGPQVIEIDLLENYPREKPYFTYKTEIFHPNFGNYICIADHWAPSSKLTDLIYQIGDMLLYKTFNSTSPLNAKAAVWALNNIEKFPTEKINLRMIDFKL
jgi:ubiquitin-protein ligase